MTWFQRAACWLAKREIARAREVGQIEGESRGWSRGVAEGYAFGRNRAVNEMRAEMQAARCELDWLRAVSLPTVVKPRTKRDQVH